MLLWVYVLTRQGSVDVQRILAENEVQPPANYAKSGAEYKTSHTLYKHKVQYEKLDQF